RGVPADRGFLAARLVRPRGGGACRDRALRRAAGGVLPQRSLQLVQLLRLLARRRYPDPACAASAGVRRQRRAVGVATLALAAACAATAQTAAAPAFDELLQLFALRRHGHVAFTEVQQLAMLERPLKSSGELLYDAPDRLEKRTLKPRAQTLVLEHGVLTARRGQHTYVMELREHPQVAPFVESIRATLAGDRAALERSF